MQTTVPFAVRRSPQLFLAVFCWAIGALSSGTPTAFCQTLVPAHLSPLAQSWATSDFDRQAVQQAIASIEKSMAVYRQHRQCFSCHHHAHPIMALSQIATRGFAVDQTNLNVQLDATLARTHQVLDRYQNGKSIGGGVDTTGYTLLALKARHEPPNATTQAMIDWLLNRNQKSVYWSGTETRPPTQTSNLTRAWLCIEAMHHYGTTEQQARIDERIAKLKNWILDTAAPTTEDQVSRLRALHAIGNATDAIANFADQLIAGQRNDGGWAQTSEMQSDAYATGSVLMALHQIAGVESDSDVYRRGIAYLRSTQRPDGTWHVTTRAQPIQEYFESGFPHGRDQFISITATCWSATAIALTFPCQEIATD